MEYIYNTVRAAQDGELWAAIVGTAVDTNGLGLRLIIRPCLSGSVVRTSVSGRRTFPDLRQIYCWPGDHSVGKLSAVGQPT